MNSCKSDYAKSFYKKISVNVNIKSNIFWPRSDAVAKIDNNVIYHDDLVFHKINSFKEYVKILFKMSWWFLPVLYCALYLLVYIYINIVFSFWSIALMIYIYSTLMFFVVPEPNNAIKQLKAIFVSMPLVFIFAIGVIVFDYILKEESLALHYNLLISVMFAFIFLLIAEFRKIHYAYKNNILYFTNNKQGNYLLIAEPERYARYFIEKYGNKNSLNVQSNNA